MNAGGRRLLAAIGLAAALAAAWEGARLAARIDAPTPIPATLRLELTGPAPRVAALVEAALAAGASSHAVLGGGGRHRLDLGCDDADGLLAKLIASVRSGPGLMGTWTIITPDAEVRHGPFP